MAPCPRWMRSKPFRPEPVSTQLPTLDRKPSKTVTPGPAPIPAPKPWARARAAHPPHHWTVRRAKGPGWLTWLSVRVQALITRPRTSRGRARVRARLGLRLQVKHQLSGHRWGIWGAGIRGTHRDGALRFQPLCWLSA